MKKPKESRYNPLAPSVKRYGHAGVAGFTMVPNVLLFQQAKLGLTNTSLLVLLNLMLHFREEGELVYPTTDKIAKRMGVSRRTVQIAIHSLESLGLIREALCTDPRKPAGARAFDLSPLAEELSKFLPYELSFRPPVDPESTEATLANVASKTTSHAKTPSSKEWPPSPFLAEEADESPF